MLVAEGFYCIGVILAFARILYIFQISQVHKIIKNSVFLPFNISHEVLPINFSERCNPRINNSSSNNIYHTLRILGSWSNPIVIESDDQRRTRDALYIFGLSLCFCTWTYKIILLL